MSIQSLGQFTQEKFNELKNKAVQEFTKPGFRQLGQMSQDAFNAIKDQLTSTPLAKTLQGDFKGAGKQIATEFPKAYAQGMTVGSLGPETAYLSGESKVVKGLIEKLNQSISKVSPQLGGKYLDFIDKLSQKTVSAKLVDEVLNLLKK